MQKHTPPPVDEHPLEDDLVQALPDRRTTLGVLLRRWALRIIPLVLLVAAAYVLWRDYQHLGLDDIAAEVRRWGYPSMVAAFFFRRSAFS